MQAIADSVPAIIAYFDRNVVYGFANAGVGEFLGVDARTLIGRTLREAMGDETYSLIAPHISAALCGERRTYERIANVHGETRCYEITFIPDIAEDGSVRGFFALSYNVTERKKTERVLDHLARHDPLTGLANRREFEERVESARAKSANGTFALILLDVDYFKQINDGRGHAAGDAVLVAVAKRLQSCVFDVDLVARLGGDEFAIFMDEPGSENKAEEVARRIMRAMKKPISADAQMINATLSVGVALVPATMELDAMKPHADRALYDSKAAGRDTFRFADARSENRTAR